jgi:predicted DNA-binding antitoxin AbrB/MazE fold protein
VNRTKYTGREGGLSTKIFEKSICGDWLVAWYNFSDGAIMTTIVHAIYQHGVFLPSTPPAIAEGEEVELIVTSGVEKASLADALDEIAGLPVEGVRDGLSGAEHDKVIYTVRVGNSDFTAEYAE